MSVIRPPSLLFAALVFVLPVAAGEELVIMPQGNSTCVVDVVSRALETHKTPDGEPDLGKLANLPIVTGIRITRSASLVRYDILWVGNRRTETWVDEDAGLGVQEHPRTGRIIVMPAGELPVPLLAGGSPASVAWMRPQDFVQEERFEGRAARHFQRAVELPDENQALYQAWADPETKLPLAMDDGTALYRYLFEAPPAAPLVMPEKFHNALRKYRRSMTPPARL